MVHPDAPERHFGEQVQLRDHAGWRRERMPAPPTPHIVDVARDCVCEILSPATELRDRNQKAGIDLAAGIGHHWLLSPAAPMLETFVARDGLWPRHRVYGPEDEVDVPPFPGAAFMIETLWT